MQTDLSHKPAAGTSVEFRVLGKKEYEQHRMEWIRWGVLIGLLSSAMVVALATFFITGVSVIDPSTVMQICDGIDDAGRMLGSIAVALLVATAVIVTAALFLGLAIRAAGRAIIRRFAERRI